MSGKYFSKREKVRDFIETNILPIVEKTDIDYNKTVDLVSYEVVCSHKIVVEMLDGIIASKRLVLQKDGVITIPDDELPTFIERIKTEEKIAEENKKKIEEELKALEKQKWNRKLNQSARNVTLNMNFILWCVEIAKVSLLNILRWRKKNERK